MTVKKTAPAVLPALGQLPRFEDLVAELGAPNLTKAKTYTECVELAWREVKK